jgi:hypothetical protein
VALPRLGLDDDAPTQRRGRSAAAPRPQLLHELGGAWSCRRRAATQHSASHRLAQRLRALQPTARGRRLPRLRARRRGRLLHLLLDLRVDAALLTRRPPVCGRERARAETTPGMSRIHWHSRISAPSAPPGQAAPPGTPRVGGSPRGRSGAISPAGVIAPGQGYAALALSRRQRARRITLTVLGDALVRQVGQAGADRHCTRRARMQGGRRGHGIVGVAERGTGASAARSAQTTSIAPPRSNPPIAHLPSPRSGSEQRRARCSSRSSRPKGRPLPWSPCCAAH